MRILPEFCRAETRGLKDRIDSDGADWDDAVARFAVGIRDLTPQPLQRLNIRRRRVQGVEVREVVPRWDAKAGCWVRFAPAGMGGSGRGPGARPGPPDARLEGWQALRDHPLFGSLVDPAREAAGGWLEEADFWELVEEETLRIKKAQLGAKWGSRKFG